MLMEWFVAVMALIAASIIDTLAVGMSEIFVESHIVAPSGLIATAAERRELVAAAEPRTPQP